MKRNLNFLVFLILGFNIVKAQTVINIDQDLSNPVYYIEGIKVKNKCSNCEKLKPNMIVFKDIIFYPKNDQSNRPDSLIKFCNNFTKYFNLNGLKISEETFNKLNFKKKDFGQYHNYYSYNFKGNDTNSCVTCLYLLFDLKIPVKVNNFKLKNCHEEYILRIISEDIKSIQIKRKFGRKYLDIITN